MVKSVWEYSEWSALVRVLMNVLQCVGEVCVASVECVEEGCEFESVLRVY